MPISSAVSGARSGAAARAVARRLSASSASRLSAKSCTNGVYLLAGTPWVVRVAAAGADVARLGLVVAVLADAAAAGVPVIAPAPLPQPLVGARGQWAATVFERVETTGGPLDWGHVGAALRALHDHRPAPAHQATLGRLDDLAAVRTQVAAAADAGLISAVDADVLDGWADLLGSALADVPGPVVLSHGDLWAKNVLAVDGGAVLCDPDNVAMAPATWDVASVIKSHHQGVLDADELARFFDAYGAAPPPPLLWQTCTLAHDLRWTAWVVAHRDQTAATNRWATGMLERWHRLDREVSWATALG